MHLFATIIAALGSLLASMGSQACFLVVLDEPECPKSLLK